MKSTILILATILTLAAVAAVSQTQIANNAAEIAGKIVMLADGGTARTVTGSFTFDRDPSAPFGVTSGSAVVTNLDADLLDGLTSARFNTTYVTTTSTGSQDDFDPGLNASGGRTVIRANNASLLTITGFDAGAAISGQQILVEAINGQVDFDPTPSASAAANELIHPVTSGNTSIVAGGSALYVYDATTAMWRLAAHEQGDPISYTPTWTGAGGNPAIGNGTLAGQFYLRGTLCWIDIRIVMGSTTTFGTGAWSNALPYTAVATAGPALLSPVFTAALFDTGTNYRVGFGLLGTTTTAQSIFDSATAVTATTVPITWANGDELRISGEFLVN